MDDRIDEIVSKYFEVSDYQIDPVPFGLTNLTKILTWKDHKYVIRIYNRHTKTIEGLKFESEVTAFLCRQNLSVVVPVFLNTKTCEQYVQFSDGTLGAIVSFVEGIVPEITTTQQATNFGKVVGEISSALRYFQPEHMCEGIPFTEIYRLHPLADYHAVASFITAPPFEISQTALHFYRETLSVVERSKHELLDLPRQFVHHDLLIFNLLSKDKEINGVLDFDFTSFDIGFMEFSISLNHVIHLSNGSWELTEAFINGYSYSLISKCTYREINQLRLLTRIYHIAVLHFYIGQHYAGKNIEHNFLYILNQFQTRDEWLNKNNHSIMYLLEKHLIEGQT